MKQKIATALLVLLAQLSFSQPQQPPIISSIDKQSGAYGETVTITGSNFGDNPLVFFGGVKAVIKSIAVGAIQVAVPASVLYDNIRVLNTTNKLVGYSSAQFFQSFGGESGIARAKFAANVINRNIKDNQDGTAAATGLYDVCSCDFNGDGLADLATANISESPGTVVFQSNSTLGNVSFTSRPISLGGTTTFHVTCGDLDGDGKPDIVASEFSGQGSGGNTIFIFRNTTAPGASSTFRPAPTIVLSGKTVKRVAIADVNLDGKNEIIVTNTNGKSVTVLFSENFVFSSTMLKDIALPSENDALDVRDLNGDKKPEIIAGSSNGEDIFILPNISSQTNFAFGVPQTIKVGQSVRNLRIGDLDGDGKADIAAIQNGASQIAVLKNKSTPSQISFADALSFETSTRPWGLDFGDLDGDGKLDIAVSHTDGLTVQKQLTVLNNTTSSGVLSFTRVDIGTQFINRQPRIADLDGDAKPELFFASSDFVSTNGSTRIPASKISIFKNTSCLKPTIVPKGPLTICSGFPLLLVGTSSPSGTTLYTWTKDGSNATSEDLAIPSTFSIPNPNTSNSGKYKITTSDPSGGCERISNEVEISVLDEKALANVTLSANNTPVCTGIGQKQLELVLGGADASNLSFTWTGPASFTSSDKNAKRSFSTIEMAGTYSVDVFARSGDKSCLAASKSVSVDAIDFPDVTISSNGSNQICQGATKTFTTSPTLDPSSGFGFSWFGATGPSLSSDPSYSTRTADLYKAKVTKVGCIDKETAVVALSVLAPPIADFSTSPSQLCSDNQVEFVNATKNDGTAPNTPVSSWDFGDGSAKSADANPKYIYKFDGNVAKTFTVALTSSYKDVEGCTSSKSKDILVNATKKPIIAPAVTGICDGETITLTVDGEFKTIKWSTNENGASTKVTSPGKVTATTEDSNGCPSKAELELAQNTLPNVTVTAEKISIARGQSVRLTASGATSYSWTPVETLDNPLIDSPTAKPIETTTYIVTGKNEQCSKDASIEISVFTDTPTIKAPNVFSPNGDGTNDLWKIPNAELYSECTLTVFDRSGLKVLEQKGYKNDWNGTYNGKQVPEGVYYYILFCPNSSEQTGNILVAR